MPIFAAIGGLGVGGAAAIGAGASLIGASAQAKAARNATNAQTAAGDKQLALAKETRDLTRADFAPFLKGGLAGNQAYLSEFGLAARPDGFTGYQKSPGYDFQMQQGVDALESTAAARGGLYSGAALQASQTYGQGLANQDYGNYLNRLAAIGQSGQAAAGMQADANTNYAQMGTNALAGIGNAQAAGAIARGNAINSGIGNAVGAINYMMQPGQNSGQSGGFNMWGGGGNLMSNVGGW